MLSKEQKYVIGVDGGGTKTVAALADLNVRILKIGRSGPSNLRNVGIKKAVENVSSAVKQTFVNNKKIEIQSILIGLPAFGEEFKDREKEIKKEFLKQKGLPQTLKSKINIISDQEVAFRSGTDGKEGILLIAGTGCVARGWRGKKEARASGWGWLTDEGSAFWIGNRALVAVFKDFDGRGAKTLITKLIFQQFGIRDKKDLLLIIYSENQRKILPFLSILVDAAARKGDKIAKGILKEGGKELALSAKTVIKKLNFQKDKFPIILVGGMFKSKIFLDTVKKEIKKTASKANIIFSKEDPVVGAVKLAIESLK